MKIKMLAAAAACALTGAAMAQSNTTIYGVIDINYANYAGSGGKDMAAIDPGGISGSRLGFKGSEDLGNGLKAIYTFEFGSLKNDINSGITGARQSFVGLQGSWGTLIGGYIYSPADDMNSSFDGLSNSALLSARSNMLNDGGFSTKTDDTFENAIGYISPTFNGLTLRAVFGLGEQTAGAKERKYAVAAEYENGPFKATGIYHYVDNKAGVVPQTDQREVGLGVGYDFGVAKLLATYASKRLTDADRDNTWALGAHIPAGRGSVRLSYARLNMADDNGDKDAAGWTVAYFYDLSKRTTLYTGYHALDNGSNANYNHERLTGLATGSNARLFALGIRHKF
jgi:predicted porin